MVYMSCGFVWKVKGTYTRPEVLNEDFEVPDIVDFECLVLTLDPQAHDVAALALEMRIGPRAHWERYNAQVTSMKLLGWAQGEKEVVT
jgi:hypothetical protein